MLFRSALSPDGDKLAFASYGSATVGTLGIDGKDLLDYVITVQQINETEVVFFDEMRSDNELLNLDAYQSKGVLILHEGDTHKTPVRNISYNVSYWYEVSIE